MGYTNAWGFHLEAKFGSNAQRALIRNFQKRCCNLTHWIDYSWKRSAFGAKRGWVEQIWRAKASFWWLGVSVRKTWVRKSTTATYDVSFDQTNWRVSQQCWRGNAYGNHRWRGKRGGQVSWICGHYTTYQAQLSVVQLNEHAFRPIDGRAQGENEAPWGLS